MRRRRPLHRGTVKTVLGLDVLAVDFGCVDEAAELGIFQFEFRGDRLITVNVHDVQRLLLFAKSCSG